MPYDASKAVVPTWRGQVESLSLMPNWMMRVSPAFMPFSIACHAGCRTGVPSGLRSRTHSPVASMTLWTL